MSMIVRRIFLPVFVTAGILVLDGHAQASLAGSASLWYRQPAKVPPVSLPWSSVAGVGNMPGKPAADPWASQSLPVGNGRMGGTIFGGNVLDRVNLNEVSLWTGGANEPQNGRGYEYGPLADKNSFGSYQPFGNLYVEFEHASSPTAYQRCLDLEQGVARVAFTAEGVKHQRECFISHPDQVLVYRAHVDQPGHLSARIAMLPCHSVHYAVKDNVIVMRGELVNGEKFEGRMAVRTIGGSCSISGGAVEVPVTYSGRKEGMVPVVPVEQVPYISVQQANSVEIYITLATDYQMDVRSNWKGRRPEIHNARVLAKALKKGYGRLWESHLADYRHLYNRLSLSLGKSPQELAKLPTDERLQRYRERQDDPELEAIIYQYGRYLLIAGSRPGSLPLNLQGIWNDKVHAAWACDYHNNINLQMCYWGAEVANLSECHLPLLAFIRAMEGPLHAMTQREFGVRTPGWTARISQNPWGGGGWKMWNPPVNAWYGLHLWEHFQYTQDKDYLAHVAYPALKRSCQFWEKRLKKLGEKGQGLMSDNKPLRVEDHPELSSLRAGSLVAPQGWSHEWGPVEDGCAHDQQLIRELFGNTICAAQVLGVDAAWTASLAEKLKQLVGDRVGQGGYLQEWIVDRPEMVTGHRHCSHLIGVYPGSSISLVRTPELAQAAMRSLELRGTGGDSRRSWTWPWRAALWARLGCAEQAHQMVEGYIRYNLLDNLFANHPPMQLDGAYGMTAAMSEMLVQSHAGVIDLLPALPEAWREGFVQGIRVRGNITVDLAWKNGQLTFSRLATTNPRPEVVTVRCQGHTWRVKPEVLSR